jgi:DNA-binding NtrC family response regulator
MMTAAIETADGPRARNEQPSPLSVLVVDDEGLVRWSICETLSDCGFQTIEAGDAQSAWTAFLDRSHPIDVAVLDLHLPDSDDLSLLARMRKASPGTPVILMTAFGTPEIVSAALDLGACRVLSKPFDVEELPRVVDEATGQR